MLIMAWSWGACRQGGVAGLSRVSTVNLRVRTVRALPRTADADGTNRRPVNDTSDLSRQLEGTD